MATFFAQVFDSEKEDEDDECCVLWVGMTPEALGTVEALQACLQPFARLAEDLETLLRADQQQRRPRSPLQDTVVQWMSGAPSASSPVPMAEEDDEELEDDGEHAYYSASLDAEYSASLVRALTNVTAEDHRVFAAAIQACDDDAAGPSLAALRHLTAVAEAILHKEEDGAACS